MGMFYGCSSLTSLDINNLKTKDKMNKMLKNCKNLKLDNVHYRDFKIRNQLLIDLK